MLDPIEIELQQKFINAKYDYIEYLRKKQLPKFLEETHNYVWDETHWAYDIWFKNTNNSNDNDKNPNLKQLYYKLSKIVHPDKCKEVWSERIFIIINESYNTNNYQKLQEISDYWDKNGTFEFYLDEISFKIKSINSWTHEAWYDWFNNSPSTLRMVLISPHEYENRLQKRLKELQQENKRLQETIKLLQ